MGKRLIFDHFEQYFSVSEKLETIHQMVNGGGSVYLQDGILPSNEASELRPGVTPEAELRNTRPGR